MKTIFVSMLLLLCIVPKPLLRAQAPEPPPTEFQPFKKFETPLRQGDIMLRGIRHELRNNIPCTVFELETQFAGSYIIQALGNFSTTDGVFLASGLAGSTPPDLDQNRPRYSLKIPSSGWQAAKATGTGGEDKVFLPTGKVDLFFFTKSGDFALVDRVSVTESGVDEDFADNVTKVTDFVKQQKEQGPSSAPKEEDPNARIIPNPLGNYSHQVNEWYTYSTFTYLSLTAGTVVTLETNTTVGGTSDPVLHLFDPNNPDARSWTDDDSGPGLESKLTVLIPTTATYVVLARPYSDNVTGTTNIKKNGANWLLGTPIGGRRFTHTAYTGLRNFFTSYMIGDTRLFTLNNVAGNVRGYNDDYGGPGTFAWGLRSRITKNFPTAINTTYVCAYSTYVSTTGGITDTYMGNPNGAAYAWFTSFNANDCIQSAPSSGVYNCISWSGGITTFWVWPPSDPAYNTPPGQPELIKFDRYYNNMPLRYTGAWNYNRGGANVNNAVIDLWKLGTGAGGYTHASVKKPGNNNPHGYDWESKPGSLDRCFHPRNALAGTSYGAVTDYYVFDGTVGKNAAGQPVNKDLITCDADAVRLGFDVYENARLSNAAQQKLTSLLGQANPNTANEFARLYDAWKATWGNFAGASNPDAYTKNHEYDLLLTFSTREGKNILPLLFNRYIQGDFLSTPLLWTLTKPTYEALIEEVKQDIFDNPNDAQGRHIIRSTFGNNVLYIEKMLGQLQGTSPFTVTVSPNPVSDRLNVEITLTGEGKVNITAMSAQTGAKITMVRDASLAAGTHRFNASARQFAGGMGDIISVQVQVNGTTQTIKAMVGQ